MQFKKQQWASISLGKKSQAMAERTQEVLLEAT